MQGIKISRLLSGGIITNYYCSSTCRHCLYACSPKRSKDYIQKESASEILEKIKSLGCTSIHVGGGEPFLNFQQLLDFIETANRNDIGIEYVETNSSWYKDENSSIKILNELKKLDISTLLISISPFHNEYIPFYKVHNLMKISSSYGINVFPWVMDFYHEISSFDTNITHSIYEYRMKFGDEYLKNILSRYWIHFGGRAIDTFQECLPIIPIESILKDSSGCVELTNTTHFHIDLYGNYIPGLCSGFSISYNDIGKFLDADKYKFISILYNQGIKGLYSLAQKEFNFVPENGYISKCHLCQSIRKFLVKEKELNSIELQPIEFYNSI